MLQRDAVFETSESDEIIISVERHLILIHDEWDDHPGCRPGTRLASLRSEHVALGKMKALREHPDDLQESSVKTKAFAQHMGIGSEVPLPEIMGDDGDVIMSGRAFFGKECPSKLGLHAKNREEIGVAKHHANDARVFVSLSDSSCALSKKSDIREIRGALLPILLMARVSFKVGSIRAKIFHFFPDGD